MAVILPDPGESPWGEELNAAIRGIDTDLQATKTRLTGDETSFDARLDALEAASTVTAVAVVPGTWIGAPTNTHAMTVSITPAWASNKKVTWATSDPAIATVDQTGLVTAVALGAANITATSQQNGIVGIAVVTVAGTVPATGVTMAPDLGNLSVGGTLQMTTTVTPSNASDKTVTYTSDNLAVATVSLAGLVTAVAVGTAVITVTSTSGSFADTSTINVT
jgi:uncharacterized protein YjdB